MTCLIHTSPANTSLRHGHMPTTVRYPGQRARVDEHFNIEGEFEISE